MYGRIHGSGQSLSQPLCTEVLPSISDTQMVGGLSTNYEAFKWKFSEWINFHSHLTFVWHQVNVPCYWQGSCQNPFVGLCVCLFEWKQKEGKCQKRFCLMSRAAVEGNAPFQLKKDKYCIKTDILSCEKPGLRTKNLKFLQIAKKYPNTNFSRFEKNLGLKPSNFSLRLKE